MNKYASHSVCKFSWTQQHLSELDIHVLEEEKNPFWLELCCKRDPENKNTVFYSKLANKRAQ